MQIKLKILKKIWDLSIFFNLYALSALVLKACVKPVSSKKSKNILVLAKPIFNEDIKNIDKASPQIGFLNFPRLFLNTILIKYCAFYGSLTEENYHSKMHNTKAQSDIAYHTKKVLDWLTKILDFDGVISGNYVYLNQQEFFYICKEENIPVFVLYKEGLAPTGSFNTSVKERLYSGKKFIGSDILFYNSQTKKTLIDANLPGIYPANTHVVGVPRLDPIFKTINQIKTINKTSQRKSIALFGYYPKQKAIRFCNNDSLADKFENNLKSFIDAVIDFAIVNPDWVLQIKFKSDKKSREYLSYLEEKIIAGGSPNNIKFTDKNSVDLISSSEYICGFASTVLLEALALNKKIIIPDTAEFVSPSNVDYFYPNKEIASYFNPGKKMTLEFFNTVKNSGKNELIKKEILTQYVHKTDGHSSKRVYNILINLLK